MSGRHVGPGRPATPRRRGFSSTRLESLERRELMATFTVTNITDGILPVPPGSLRQAILQSNVTPGNNTIVFAIGSGPRTITPVLPLPALLSPVLIDGTTQPGYSGGPLIEINGTKAGATDGFRVESTGTTLKGLLIDQFDGNGVLIQADGTTIQGDFIGVTFGGVIGRPNTAAGIRVESSNNTIGVASVVATSGFGNLISGNGGPGILLVGSSATNNIILNNQIGTDTSTARALPNGGDGITLQSAGLNTIGGKLPGQTNYISGNSGNGISITGGTPNTIQGNTIGLDRSGSTAVGNGGNGITISGSDNNVIGGTATGAQNVISGNTGNGINIAGSNTTTIQSNIIGATSDGASDAGNGAAGILLTTANNTIVGGRAANSSNIIAYNGKITSSKPGVDVVSGTGNQILGNSIFANRGLGIDLGDDGPTLNTPGSPHTGPNLHQNFPVLTNTVTAAGRTLVQGNLSATPNTTYLLQFFISPQGDKSGYGQGMSPLNNPAPNNKPIFVTTDGAGNAIINIQLNTVAGVGQAIAVTATDPNNNTSEFSAFRAVSPATIADLAVFLTSTPNPATLGATYTYTISVLNNGKDIATGVTATDAFPTTLRVNSVIMSQGTFSSVGNTYTFNFTPGPNDTVAVNQTVTATVVVTPTTTGAIVDTVSVSGAQIEPDLTNNTATNTTTINVPADLAVSTTQTPAKPFVSNDINSFVEYRVIVTNKGPGTADDVVLTDTLPTGVTLISALSGGQVIDPPVNGVLTANLGTLTAGAAVAVVIRVHPLGAGTFVNTATASATETDPDTTNNTSTITTTVSPASDLAVALSGSPTQLSGSTLTYVVTVTNNGPSPTSNLTITDALPPQLQATYVSAQAGFGGSTPVFNPVANTVTAAFGIVPPQGTATLTINLTPIATGPIVDSATADPGSGVIDPDPTNNNASFTTIIDPADLALTEIISPTIGLIGQPLIYQFTVVNNGSATADNSVLTDTLPAGVTYFSGGADQGTVSVANGVVTASLGRLALNQVDTIRVTVIPQVSQVVVNTATVKSDQTDSNPTNNTVTSATPISPADLAVTVSSNEATANVGDNLTYTVVVANNGPVAASNVQIIDTLPVGVRFVSTTGTNGIVAATSPANGVLLATIPSLAAGQAATLTIQVVPTAVGNTGDMATVSATELDLDTTNNHAAVATTIINLPGTISFATPTYTVADGSPFAVITLVRTGGTNGPLTVTYTADDSRGANAVPGVDYIPTAGTVVFADGQSTASFNVPIVANSLIQPTRSVALSLQGTNLGVQATSTLLITNTNRDFFGPQAVDANILGARAATGIGLVFNKLLAVPAATNPANYRLIAVLRGRDVPTAIGSVLYNPANGTVSVNAARPLALNTIYRVIVNAGPGGLTDTLGNSLNGGSGNGSTLALSFARGTNLTYGDKNGDAVNLKLTRGGFLDLIRGADGEARVLRLVNTVRGKSVLSGSVRQGPGGDGITTIQSIVGLDPFNHIRSTLKTPPFYVATQVAQTRSAGTITVQAVDLALASTDLARARTKKAHR